MMGRRQRIWYEGAIYHLINRGNNQQNIFHDLSDRFLFLNKLEQLSLEHELKIFAFCLMTNHYHLLLQTGMIHIAKTMHQLHTYYAKQHNIKYNVKGQLFQERYRSILVERDSYLLDVSRYIHLNPVQAGLVRLPVDYSFSSMKFYLGLPYNLPLTIQTDLPLLLLSNNTVKSRKMYLDYVHAQLGKEYSLESYITDDDILGSENFVQEINAKYL